MCLPTCSSLITKESSSLKLRFLARELSKFVLHPCFRRDRGNLNFGQNPNQNAPRARLSFVARPAAKYALSLHSKLAKASIRPIGNGGPKSPLTDSRVTMIRRRTLLLLATAEALVAPVTRRTTTKLHAIDAVVLEQCAGYAAIPTCFVGTGAFLLGREPEGTKLEGALLGNNGEVLSNDPVEEGEVDIYRDTALRYAGYANEVGEAFAPLTPGWCVPFSYAVAITYVIADTVDKTKKVLDGTKYSGENLNTCAAIEGVDALIWQLAASVALPGYTIHQLVAIVVALLDASGVDQTGVISALPTACGLAMIPFIVKPLDELAEVAMDVTFRKVSAPYLESCEV